LYKGRKKSKVTFPPPSSIYKRSDDRRRSLYSLRVIYWQRLTEQHWNTVCSTGFHCQFYGSEFASIKVVQPYLFLLSFEIDWRLAVHHPSQNFIEMVFLWKTSQKS
jgi:hypothetical protein